MVMAIDTECTGLDFCHGCRPFFITTCNQNGKQLYWEFNVDPLTRMPIIPDGDVQEISVLLEQTYLEAQDNGDEFAFVFQHGKYDVAALKSIGVVWNDCYWKKTADTLMSAHILASNRPKDLTSLAMTYLGKNIKPLEEALREAVNHARRITRLKANRELFGSWRIAEKGDEMLPSTTDSMSLCDYWLPRAIWKVLGDKAPEGFENVLSTYSNTDSGVTVAVWSQHYAELRRRGLWEIFLERMKLVPIAHGMEQRGVTISQKRLYELETDFTKSRDQFGQACLDIAKKNNYDLVMPKGASPNNSLRKFCFDVLNLPPRYSKKSKTFNPSLDKDIMAEYTMILPQESDGYKFVTNLLGKRKLDTSLAYMAGYRRYWVPFPMPEDCLFDRAKYLDWRVLHSSINPTGSDTLRWSSSNPNSQNISKLEEFSLRYAFGPAPGREWWAMDYENIELRIPAYEAGEKEMIFLFEHPEEPPYFGSKHLLVFSILHPEDWKQYGVKVKEVYASTKYQWTKNGNFAVQYGAIESSGTADRAYHVQGAQRLIAARFKEQEKLNQFYIEYARKYGYVETLPDKTVNPNKGYPIMCSRTDDGDVLPTVPLNYHVQSTAMWCTGKAMIRTQNQLNDWNRLDRARQYWIGLQVHDELVFDMPYVPNKGNLPKAMKLKYLMEKSGEDIGIPLRVSMKYIPDGGSWGARKKKAA